jgi:hypothetical protein
MREWSRMTQGAPAVVVVDEPTPVIFKVTTDRSVPTT